MPSTRSAGLTRSVLLSVIGAMLAISPVTAASVELQPDTKGCTGVLPSTDGNTDMRVVGGTLTPGGTAVFEITYPLDASDIGKQFTITACAFIDDVARLKYLVSFVPSNESFTLRMTFAIPEDARVGGTYCNYAKTTRSPTAAQASQRKAGPACFVIRSSTLPPGNGAPTPSRSPMPSPGGSGSTTTYGGASVSPPVLLPDTAMAGTASSAHRQPPVYRLCYLRGPDGILIGLAEAL